MYIRRCPGRLLNILCKFNLSPVSTGKRSGNVISTLIIITTAIMTLSAHLGNLKIYSSTLGYVFLKCFEKDILKNKGLTDTFHGF